MYTGMLDVAARDKNIKVCLPKLTHCCSTRFSRLISYVTNMLCAYLEHNIYDYRIPHRILLYLAQNGER